MKKEYEIVWEIFNECANNQMRDVFFEEAFVEDTDAYVKGKIKGTEVVIDRTVKEDGTIIYNINASGILQRISFTEI